MWGIQEILSGTVALSMTLSASAPAESKALQKAHEQSINNSCEITSDAIAYHYLFDDSGAGGAVEEQIIPWKEISEPNCVTIAEVRVADPTLPPGYDHLLLTLMDLEKVPGLGGGQHYASDQACLPDLLTISNHNLARMPQGACMDFQHPFPVDVVLDGQLHTVNIRLATNQLHFVVDSAGNILWPNYVEATAPANISQVIELIKANVAADIWSSTAKKLRWDHVKHNKTIPSLDTNAISAELRELLKQAVPTVTPLPTSSPTPFPTTTEQPPYEPPTIVESATDTLAFYQVTPQQATAPASSQIRLIPSNRLSAFRISHPGTNYQNLIDALAQPGVTYDDLVPTLTELHTDLSPVAKFFRTITSSSYVPEAEPLFTTQERDQPALTLPVQAIFYTNNGITYILDYQGELVIVEVAHKNTHLTEFQYVDLNGQILPNPSQIIEAGEEWMAEGSGRGRVENSTLPQRGPIVVPPDYVGSINTSTMIRRPEDLEMIIQALHNRGYSFTTAHVLDNQGTPLPLNLPIGTQSVVAARPVPGSSTEVTITVSISQALPLLPSEQEQTAWIASLQSIFGNNLPNSFEVIVPIVSLVPAVEPKKEPQPTPTPIFTPSPTPTFQSSGFPQYDQLGSVIHQAPVRYSQKPVDHNPVRNLAKISRPHNLARERHLKQNAQMKTFARQA